MDSIATRGGRGRGRRGGNGGFPEPVAGEPVRVVRRHHPACGAETRVRLPRALPETAVRRVVCDRCAEGFEAPSPPAAQRSPAARSRAGWAWASAPLAALGVVAGLALIQDSGPDPAPPDPPEHGLGAASAGAEAKLIQRPGFSLALPPGWKRAEPPSGATFAAAPPDGLADATLWIEHAPDLSFKQFERRSLQQLGELGGEARVVDRVGGPTLESSLVELRTDAPLGDGLTAPYRVTLRAAGPYRLYFVTVVQPGANAGLLADVELLHGSLRPEVPAEGGGR